MVSGFTGDMKNIHCRTKELINSLRNMNRESAPEADAEAERILEDCRFHLDSISKENNEACAALFSLDSEVLEACVKRVEEDIKAAEAENMKISEEIQVMNESFLTDFARVETDLKCLCDDLEDAGSQDLGKLGSGHVAGSLALSEDGNCLGCSSQVHYLEMLEIDHHIEKKRTTLHTLQDLDYVFHRMKDIEQVEDILSDVKIIEFEGNYIRLSIKTFFPISEFMMRHYELDSLRQHFIVDHELLIELVDGTLKVQNVKIFPDDTYIEKVVDAVKASRISLSPLSGLGLKSSLPLLVRKIQYRIFLSNLRRLIVKDANNSRYTLEYSDRLDRITAHFEGIDADIEVPDNWPASLSALRLTSLSNSGSLEISLTILQEIQDRVNSIDLETRQELVKFVDAIEQLIVQQKLGGQ